MPLDPLVKAFLDSARRFRAPKSGKMPLAAVRQSFAGMMGLVGPKMCQSARSKILSFRARRGRIRLRSYAPVAAGGEALPALVYFHGGGFWWVIWIRMMDYAAFSRMLAFPRHRGELSPGGPSISGPPQSTMPSRLCATCSRMPRRWAWMPGGIAVG